MLDLRVISVYAEFASAETVNGALSYASTLNTDSCVLTATKNSAGTAIDVATKSSNNVDQASFTGALRYCPYGGRSAACGVFSIGSNSNGLSGGIGVGGLVAHRVIGLFAGVGFGQATVLDSQYTAGVSAIPSGATYTHMALRAGGFVGVSLNIPSM